MDNQFKPPQTQEEFEERAKLITLEGAQSVLNSLRNRRQALVKNVDEEILFYKKVIDYKKEEQSKADQTSLI